MLNFFYWSKNKTLAGHHFKVRKGWPENLGKHCQEWPAGKTESEIKLLIKTKQKNPSNRKTSQRTVCVCVGGGGGGGGGGDGVLVG